MQIPERPQRHHVLCGILTAQGAKDWVLCEQRKEQVGAASTRTRLPGSQYLLWVFGVFYARPRTQSTTKPRVQMPRYEQHWSVRKVTAWALGSVLLRPHGEEHRAERLKINGLSVVSSVCRAGRGRLGTVTRYWSAWRMTQRQVCADPAPPQGSPPCKPHTDGAGVGGIPTWVPSPPQEWAAGAHSLLVTARPRLWSPTCARSCSRLGMWFSDLPRLILTPTVKRAKCKWEQTLLKCLSAPLSFEATSSAVFSALRGISRNGSHIHSMRPKGELSLLGEEQAAARTSAPQSIFGWGLEEDGIPLPGRWEAQAAESLAFRSLLLAGPDFLHPPWGHWDPHPKPSPLSEVKALGAQQAGLAALGPLGSGQGPQCCHSTHHGGSANTAQGIISECELVSQTPLRDTEAGRSGRCRRQGRWGRSSRTGRCLSPPGSQPVFLSQSELSVAEEHPRRSCQQE